MAPARAEAVLQDGSNEVARFREVFPTLLQLVGLGRSREDIAPCILGDEPCRLSFSLSVAFDQPQQLPCRPYTDFYFCSKPCEPRQPIHRNDQWRPRIPW